MDGQDRKAAGATVLPYVEGLRNQHVISMSNIRIYPTNSLDHLVYSGFTNTQQRC